MAMQGKHAEQYWNAGDAELRTISYNQLVAGDGDAAQELYKAGTESGFFYLDCTDHPSAPLLEYVEKLNKTFVDTFELPDDVKCKWQADHDHEVGKEVTIGCVCRV